MNCIKKIDIDKLLMKISKHRALRRKSQSSDLFWSAFFPHFPAFRLNTERYLSIFSPNAGKCWKNADQNNSEYGLFLRNVFPHFPAFGLNTERYLSIFSPNAGKCGKNADQNNSEYGLFLGSLD